MKDDSVLFQSRSTSGIPRARARFLAQAIRLEEYEPTLLIHGAIYFTMLTLVVTVIWASFTEVAEVSKATGEVVPAGHIHDVQHLEGGMVNEIHVRDGDRVKQGDVLLRFAPPASQSEYAQTLVRKATLDMELERLQAIVEDRVPDFTPWTKQYPGIAGKQQTIYTAQLASHQSQLNVIDAQIEQRHTELIRQKNQAESIAQELNLLKEQVNIRTQLNNKNAVARTDLLATQSRLAETQSERRRISDDIIVATSAWNEAKQRRSEAESGFRKEIELEAGGVAAKLAEVEQTLIRLQDRVSRLEVRSPLDGIVQGLSITRINAVVEPGQVILQVVPIDDDLVVEARLSPNDIGHIHAGQSADIKVNSYDSARFGSVEGVLKQISASTYLDEKRNPYYRAKIELSQSYVGNNPDQMHIIPGMTVQADIKTGAKSILDYMLKPISRGFDDAFRER